MNKLVRKQIRVQIVPVVVAEGIFGCTVVAGLVVLESMMGSLIAESNQEMILLEMMRAKQLFGFGDKPLVAGQIFVWHLQRRLTLSHHVHDIKSFAGLAELHLTIDCPGD